MPTSIIKNSFTGGEIAPSLYGRSDLSMYQNSVKEMKNFLIHPHGGTSKRPGTEFIGEVKDSSAVTRLIPFQFSVTQSYIIEVGNLYMRFYKNQGRVTESDKTITAITKANPAVVTSGTHGYTDGDWIIISAVVGMTELNGKMFKVANKNTNDFELTDVDDNDIDSSAYTTYSSGGTSEKVYELTTTYKTADIPLIKIVQSADVLYVTHPSYAPRKISRTGHTAWTIANITFQSSVTAPTGLAMTGTAKDYVVTAVVDDEESLPSTLTDGDDGETLSWTDPGSIDYWNVYLDDNGSSVYGWAGQANTNSFDVPAGGITADTDKTPPNSENPFSGADKYPGCAMFFEQRLIYARTNDNPQTIWGSTVGSFDNMNKSIPSRSDNSYQFTINSQKVNEIKWMLPLDVLLIGTAGAEWKLNAGSQSDSITPTSVLLRPQSQWGCSDIQPIQIGNTLLFTEGSKKTIRDLAYTLESDGYTGNDLTILANHLFKNTTIKEWAYEKDPNSIIWCVMADGTLLGLTFFKEHKVWGWHQHSTNGTFESVASITTSAGIDEAWFIVKRTVNGSTRRYVEFMKDGLPSTNIKDAFFVDSGLTYDTDLTITAATKADPVVVTSAAHGMSDGDLVDILDIVGMTELNGNRYKVANKATNTFELTDQNDDSDIDGTAYTTYVSGGIAKKAVTGLSGMEHLEGEAVTILADGNVTSDTVASGAIALDNAASIVTIGLAYTASIETLNIEFPTKTGQTIQDTVRNITEVSILLENTRALSVGSQSDRLTEIAFRVDELYGAPTEMYSGTKDILIQDGSSEAGRLYFQNPDPVPSTILSLAMKVEYGQD